MKNLTVTYHNLRKYEDTEKLQIQVLDMRNRLLGEEHPDTISAMSNLAVTCKSLEKYADEEKLEIDVLNLGNRLHGEEHADTITAMNNLVVTYQNSGQYADAENLQTQLLDMRKDIYEKTIQVQLLLWTIDFLNFISISVSSVSPVFSCSCRLVLKISLNL